MEVRPAGDTLQIEIVELAAQYVEVAIADSM